MEAVGTALGHDIDDGAVVAPERGVAGDERRLIVSSSKMHELILEAGRAERHYWRDLWTYRELFQVLAWRDLSVRYKQTVFGVAWAVLRPVLTMLVFTVIFGKVAKLPSEGATPYALMVFAGMLPWTFFATSLAEASNSLISNANLISNLGRLPEFGVMKALGWRRSTLFRLLCGESLVLGMASGLLAALVAVIIVRVFSLSVSLNRIALLVPLGASSFLIGALLPAGWAAWVSPTRATSRAQPATRNNATIRSSASAATSATLEERSYASNRNNTSNIAIRTTSVKNTFGAVENVNGCRSTS